MIFRLPVVPNSFPDRIAVHCLIEGVDAPQVPGAHVLEIACGQGENLIPSAYWLRDTLFQGFDSSSDKIAIAKKDADSLGIKNATFTNEEATLKKSSFDYILIPNFFSHINNETRQLIIVLACRLLKPNGMIFLRYQPQGALLRRAYLYNTLRPVVENTKNEQDANQILFDLTRELASIKPHSVRQQDAQTECRILNSYGPEGIAFQIKSDNMSPLLPSEAEKQLQTHGLTFVREMNNGGLESHRQVSAIRNFVADRLSNSIYSEDLFDLYACQEYRDEIYCSRDHLQTNRLPASDAMGRLMAQMSVSTARPDIRLDEGVEVGFITNTGAIVRSKKKVEKAILKQFSFTHGKVVSLEDIIDAGFAEAKENKEENIEAIFAGLLDLVDQGVLQLQTHVPQPRRSELPISSLTQWQAEKGRILSTRRHDLMLIDDLTRAIVFEIGRGRPTNEITEHVEELIDSGKLVLGEEVKKKNDREKQKVIANSTQEALKLLKVFEIIK